MRVRNNKLKVIIIIFFLIIIALTNIVFAASHSDITDFCHMPNLLTYDFSTDTDKIKEEYYEIYYDTWYRGACQMISCIHKANFGTQYRDGKYLLLEDAIEIVLDKASRIDGGTKSGISYKNAIAAYIGYTGKNGTTYTGAKPWAWQQGDWTINGVHRGTKFHQLCGDGSHNTSDSVQTLSFSWLYLSNTGPAGYTGYGAYMRDVLGMRAYIENAGNTLNVDGSDPKYFPSYWLGYAYAKFLEDNSDVSKNYETGSLNVGFKKPGDDDYTEEVEIDIDSNNYIGPICMERPRVITKLKWINGNPVIYDSDKGSVNYGFSITANNGGTITYYQANKTSKYNSVEEIPNGTQFYIKVDGGSKNLTEINMNCHYNTYYGRIFNFSGGGVQAVSVYSGDKITHQQSAKIKIGSSVDVSVNKYITNVTNDGNITGRDEKTNRSADPVKVEKGDKVTFTIDVTNNSDKKVKFDIEDTFDTNCFESVSGNTSVNNWTIDANAGKLTKTGLEINGKTTLPLSITLKVKENTTATSGSNTATISNFRVDNKEVTNNNENTSSSDYVSLRTYNASITKTISKLNNTNYVAGTYAEKGDTITYAITVQNTGNSTTNYGNLKEFVVEESFPSGDLKFEGFSKTSTGTYTKTGYSGNNNAKWTISDLDENNGKFKLTFSGDAASLSPTANNSSKATVYVKFTVEKAIGTALDQKITNTVDLLKNKNRNNVDIDITDNSSVDILVKVYSMGIEKDVYSIAGATNNTEYADKGDSVVFAVKVKNTGSNSTKYGSLKNYEIRDTYNISDLEFEGISSTAGGTFVTNANGTSGKWKLTSAAAGDLKILYEDSISANSSATVYVKFKVIKPITKTNDEIKNIVIVNSAQNKNGENVSQSDIRDEAIIKTRIYDMGVEKTTVKIDGQAYNENVYADRGDEVVFRIDVKNTGNSAAYGGLKNLVVTDSYVSTELRYIGISTSDSGTFADTAGDWRVSDKANDKFNITYGKTVAINGTASVYVKFELIKPITKTNDTITNNVTTVSAQNRNGEALDSENKLVNGFSSDSASFKTKIYKINVNKSIAGVGADPYSRVTDKSATVYAEKGDDVIFRIDVNNTGTDTKFGNIGDIVLTDVVTENADDLVFKGYSATTGGTYALSGEVNGWTVTATSLSHPGDIAVGGSSVIYVKYEVNRVAKENFDITNTINVSTLKNKHDYEIPLDQTAPGSVQTSSDELTVKKYTIDINKYIYSVNGTVQKNASGQGREIDKTPEVTVEFGDQIVYRIVVKNSGTNPTQGDVYNIKLSDVYSDNMLEYKSFSGTGWRKEGADFIFAGPLKVQEETVLTLTFEVIDVDISDPHAVNTAKVIDAKNKNDKNIIEVLNGTLESSDGATVLTYNLEIDKDIVKHNNDNVLRRFDMTNAEKFDSPVEVEKYDTVTYQIRIRNSGVTTIKSTNILETLENGLEFRDGADLPDKDVGSLFSGSATTVPEDELTVVRPVYDGDFPEDSSVVITGTADSIILYSSSSDRTGTDITTEVAVKSDNSQQRLFMYDKDFKPDEIIEITVTCNVVKTNLYLLNLTNDVKITSLRNSNGVEIIDTNFVVLDKNNNQDYVRLKDLIISGTVWEDKNENGLIDATEKKLQGITVYLYDVTNSKYTTTTTNENGVYKFGETNGTGSNTDKRMVIGSEGRVVKATNKDQTTGNYDPSSVHIKYYLAFEYNGAYYASTPVYANDTNINHEDNSFAEEYKVDSNASEFKDVRDKYNNDFETIYYNNAVDVSGNITELEYEKEGHTSRLKDTANSMTRAYSFADPAKAGTNGVQDGDVRYLWLTNSDIQAKYNGETEYLKYINLGLMTRGLDLSMNKDIYDVRTVINGEEMRYYFNQGNTGTGTASSGSSSTTEPLTPTNGTNTTSGRVNPGDETTPVIRPGDELTVVRPVVASVGQSDDLTSESYRLETGNNILSNWVEQESMINAINGGNTTSAGRENRPSTGGEYGGLYITGGEKAGGDYSDNAYDFTLYNSDYYYNPDQYEQYNAADLNTAGTFTNVKKDTELNTEITFKMRVTNNNIGDGKNVYTVINEVADFYSSNFIKYDPNNNIKTIKLLDENGYLVESRINKVVAWYVDNTGAAKKLDISNDSKYPGATVTQVTSGQYNALYITGFNDIKLKEGESFDFYVTFVVDTDGNKRLKVGAENNVAEINAYSTYKQDGTPAGYVDVDSNPGNLTDIDRIDLYEDDTYRTGIDLIVTAQYDPTESRDPDPKSERILTGFVWDDARSESMTVEGQNGTQYYGNGTYSSADRYNTNAKSNSDDSGKNADKPVKGVKVSMVEVIKVRDASGATRYYEASIDPCGKGATSAITKSDGKYVISSFIPGKYETRFEYGYSDSSEALLYNGQDYKSTKYYSAIDNVTTEEGVLKVLRENANVSDARDDEIRRLETITYSENVKSRIIEVLHKKASDYKEVLPPNTSMKANTAVYRIKAEDLEGNETEKSYAEYQNLLNLTNRFKVENIDFGLEYRPEVSFTLDEYITRLKVVLSTGKTLVDIQYDNVYKDNDPNKMIVGVKLNKEKSIGAENLQALPSTDTVKGFAYLNVDTDILQGAIVTIEYELVVNNESEVDRISNNLSKLRYAIDAASENYLPQYSDNLYKAAATALNELKASYYSEDGSYRTKVFTTYTGTDGYYGKYLGSMYYTGNVGSDVISELKIDKILSYVDNNTSFSQSENTEKNTLWQRTLSEELYAQGLVKEGLFTDPGKKLLDSHKISYSTDEISNLALSVDDKTSENNTLNVVNISLSKFLAPEIADENNSFGMIRLITSKVVAAENDTNDMRYENTSEIVQYTSQTGRKTTLISSVGNANIQDGEDLNEPDTASAETVALTPPTGLERTQYYMRVYAEAVLRMCVIVTIAIIIILAVRYKKTHKKVYR